MILNTRFFGIQAHNPANENGLKWTEIDSFRYIHFRSCNFIGNMQYVVLYTLKWNLMRWC